MAYIKVKSTNYNFKDSKNIIWTPRKCLPCGKIFDSWGVGNRICNKCKTTSDYKDAMPTATIKIR
jgi:hypothetical protein